jgi:tetratricopeptide (TPR) repeat protein
MEGAALPRERALVHEQIGDIYANQGNFEEAKRAYSRAKDEDPDRASIERKLGETALRLSEVKMAASGGSLDGGTFDRAAAVKNSKRNAGTALLLSFFVPGLGQFANGQAVKGALCLAVYVLTLLAMNLSPDGQAVYKQVIQFASGRPVPGASAPVSPLFWMLLALAFAVWVYSLIDAAVTASQMRRDSDTGPYVDKSGWEV